MSSSPPPSYSLSGLQLASGCLTPSSEAWHSQHVTFHCTFQDACCFIYKMPGENSGDLMLTSTYINSKSSLFLLS